METLADACDDGTFASICREAVPPRIVATLPCAVVLRIFWFDIPNCNKEKSEQVQKIRGWWMFEFTFCTVLAVLSE